ncbi:MAG: tetratricopeptide repeat protein [Treponema sp.]|jgi:putative GTP pyrophosphokinase|nr:tetratricopeptide repeat protein [Treponema sp.]
MMKEGIETISSLVEESQQREDSPHGRTVLNKQALKQMFEAGAESRLLVARDVEKRLNQTLSSLPVHPTLKVRLKKFGSYYKKYLRLLKSGIANPHITDLIGVRIVCPFIEDLTIAESSIKDHFEVIETERKGHYTFKEFGYESTHLLIKIPADIAQLRQAGCDVAEIQIRTILQDAWAEVEHELVYKAEFNPFDTPMKRKLAAVNASLSLADIIFQEIRSYQKQLNRQLLQRRETFYQKVEESTDAFLFSDTAAAQKPELLKNVPPPHRGVNSIDDLLLDALYAHNNNQFEEANALYSQILELKPNKNICSLIYKHRGMANFARSRYQDAVADFTNALELERSYKIAYYRGVVHSVQKQYAEAIDDFSMSLEINPFQAFCLFRRGQAYYHIGDYPQALSDCETSLTMEHNEAILKFRDLVQKKLKM